MSNSPYAAAAGPSGLDEYQPGRTSVLAVLAVVCAILCLPPTGILAILLGAISLSAIGRSKGRLEGRGAAISGIILGLITTVLWGAIAMGVLQGWTYYKKNLVGTGDRFFQAVAAQNFDDARSEFVPTVGESISDEQFAWFMAEIEEREGPVVGAATSLGTMFTAFKEVFEKSGGSGKANNGVNIQSNGSNAIVPVAIECANGSALAWIIFDEDTFADPSTSSPKIIDMFMLFENSDIIALRNDGPALDAARQSGLGHPQSDVEAPDAPAPEDPEEDKPANPPTS